MPKEKLPKELSVKFAEYLKLRNKQKEATNAVNREKTVLKNIFKQGIANKQFKVGTYIITGGHRFDYSASTSTKIEAEDFLKLYENKEITREDFLKCINVNKSSVETHVGSDIALELSTTTEGNTFDVRISELDIDAPDENSIVVPDTVKPIRRKKLSDRKRDVAPTKNRVRRVKVKSKK